MANWGNKWRFDWTWLGLVLLNLAFVSCRHVIGFDHIGDSQYAFAKLYHGEVVELQSSHFITDFYDENEKYLLADSCLSSAAASSKPPHTLGIAPAGTAFTIERIDFPTVWAQLTRVSTTPVTAIWVILRPYGRPAFLPQPLKPFVLILTAQDMQPATVTQELWHRLTPRDTTSKWLSQRPPSIRAAIVHKEALVGMNNDEVHAALGFEHHQSRWQNKGNDEVTLFYPQCRQMLTLLNNQVSKIETFP